MPRLKDVSKLTSVGSAWLPRSSRSRLKISPLLLEYPTGTSPGACTQRSTSVRSLSSQRISAITLPGESIAPSPFFAFGLMCGSSSTVMKTKPARVRRITSRKTVPLSSPLSHGSCMAGIDQCGGEVRGAGGEKLIVGRQPEIEDRAYQGGVECYAHAFDQRPDHAADGVHVAGGLGIDVRQRHDEPHDGADESQQDQHVGDMADEGDPREQSKLQRAGGAAPAGFQRPTVRRQPSAFVERSLAVTQVVQFLRDLVDAPTAGDKAHQEKREDQDADAAAVGYQDPIYPAVDPNEEKSGDADHVQSDESAPQ